jgi:hypothetical protein
MRVRRTAGEQASKALELAWSERGGTRGGMLACLRAVVLATGAAGGLLQTNQRERSG